MSSARDLLLAQAARTIRVEDEAFNVDEVSLSARGGRWSDCVPSAAPWTPKAQEDR